ncbi:MAG: amidohydrolase [Verrucomicrobiae bacterium]|nr:amidohydrolase [Verrucomicrobiae bacterium]
MKTRRQFLTTAAAGSASLAFSQSGIAEEKAPSNPKDGWIDAHVHVWTPDTERYPLAEGFAKEKMKPASFTPQELLAQCQPHGVSRIVLIQMSFYRFDNAYMLDAMRDHPGVFSGVAIVDENGEDVAATMKSLAERGVRGFRLYANRENAESWAGSPGMKQMWKTGAEEKLSMCCLSNADALPAIRFQCEAFPETPVVIDHFSRIGTSGTIEQGDLDNLLRLAEFETVHVKLSAFYALGAKAAPYTDLGPMIRQLRDAYGAERLMWATDCPYQVQEGHTYGDSVALIRDRLDFLSEEEKASILRKTAEKVFFS